ncbi:hypothetical protein BU24DRAFT_33945 [Aaosphaeria arxii CBS 175.79]|uniref:Uncharacterized protein n=1 Tax=Aaosphaeria arxii CBS 175.79 TaxID=1450172 RepID=A0A6A5YAD3_9PLEO|nr:uncharacterized protein BU24DRAFT_33945 [Aaosphaeria arxii CBS 175.79]KAF2021977.1 hypothetical protein BU24DRAFT_33945 [Aaosphaeria arxii CBS 175.79]
MLSVRRSGTPMELPWRRPTCFHSTNLPANDHGISFFHLFIYHCAFFTCLSSTLFYRSLRPYIVNVRRSDIVGEAAIRSSTRASSCSA